MLRHSSANDKHLDRIVILGAGGFIGREILRQLTSRKLQTLSLGRKNIDLLQDESEKKLLAILRPSDTLIFVSALAPCKNLIMLQDNLKMANIICNVLEKLALAHVIYVSSDAVYKDSLGLITEDSCAEPGSLHGIMHLAREVALRQSYSGPLAIVRPTLVYGFDDPHNGYGPNRFRRLASNGEPIILFGEGEERRDHVCVQDVADLISRIALNRSNGVINAVSGEVASFREVAEFIANDFPLKSQIMGSERIGPMPHGGYRAFNNKALLEAFPDLRFKGWREGLRLVNQTHRLES